MNQALEEVLGFIPDDPERDLDNPYRQYTKTKQIGYLDQLLGNAKPYESPRYHQTLGLFLEWKEGKDKYP